MIETTSRAADLPGPAWDFRCPQRFYCVARRRSLMRDGSRLWSYWLAFNLHSWTPPLWEIVDD